MADFRNLSSNLSRTSYFLAFAKYILLLGQLVHFGKPQHHVEYGLIVSLAQMIQVLHYRKAVKLRGRLKRTNQDHLNTLQGAIVLLITLHPVCDTLTTVIP